MPLHRFRDRHGRCEEGHRQCAGEVVLVEDRHADRRCLAGVRRVRIAFVGRVSVLLDALYRAARLEQRQQRRAAVELFETFDDVATFLLRRVGQVDMTGRAFEQRHHVAGRVQREGQRRQVVRGVAHHHQLPDARDDRDRPADAAGQRGDVRSRLRDEVIVVVEALRQRLHQRGGAVALAGRLALDQTLVHQRLDHPAGGGVGQLRRPRHVHQRQGAVAVDRLQDGDAATDRANRYASFHDGPPLVAGDASRNSAQATSRTMSPRVAVVRISAPWIDSGTRSATHVRAFTPDQRAKTGP